MLGSGNCALMSSVFAGDVADLRVWLIEERFPDQWEPSNKEAFGHTIVVSLQIAFWLHGYMLGC